LLFFRINYF